MQYESGKFCPECGAKLREVAPESVCPSCGFKPESGKFCPECGTKLSEATVVPQAKNGHAEERPSGNAAAGNGSKPASLPMDAIRRDADAPYPKQSLQRLAYGVLKIAEVIDERLPDADVSYMVHPSEFAPEVDREALPVHFLFKKNGVPRVAVVAVTENGFNTPRVLATKVACELHDIKYVRVYADGNFADWIEGWATPETVEFCHNWLVRQITENL